MANDALPGLEDFSAAKLPKRFYRFYSPKGIRAVTHGTLKLTPPKELNDPFEFWAGLDMESVDEDSVLRSLIISTGIFQEMLRGHPHAPKTGEGYSRMMSAIIREARTKPEKRIEHLRTISNALYSTVAVNIGICSLSAFSDKHLAGPIGIRHWAMYADDHRGFAIEYDARCALFRMLAVTKWLFPVDYRSKRLQVALSDFDVWNNDQLTRTLRLWSSVKCSRAWGHEREWRLVAPLGEGKPHKLFHREKTRNGSRTVIRLWSWRGPKSKRANEAQIIRRVILGTKASPKLEAAIKAALTKPHYSHVTLERASCCERDYAMNYQPIAPSAIQHA